MTSSIVLNNQTLIITLLSSNAGWQRPTASGLYRVSLFIEKLRLLSLAQKIACTGGPVYI